jgi:hypothetical protein
MRTLIALLTLAAATMIGCSGTEPTHAQASSVAEPVATASDGLVAQCVAVRNRERACTADYIPALVDLRIELDRPAGIAARAKDMGRNPLTAEALKEWQGDSAEPEAFCRQQLSKMPLPQAAGFMQNASSCAQQSSCKAFVHCWLPLIRPTLQ